jgi:hypothetical protein
VSRTFFRNYDKGMLSTRMGSFKIDFHWPGPDVGQSVCRSVGGYDLPSTVYQLTTDREFSQQQRRKWSCGPASAGEMGLLN